MCLYYFCTHNSWVTNSQILLAEIYPILVFQVVMLSVAMELVSCASYLFYLCSVNYDFDAVCDVIMTCCLYLTLGTFTTTKCLP